jgi:hypothetical protein
LFTAWIARTLHTVISNGVWQAMSVVVVDRLLLLSLLLLLQAAAAGVL